MTKYKLLIFLLTLSVFANFWFAFQLKNNKNQNNINVKNIVGQDNLKELQVKYPLLSKRILQDFPQDLLINFLDLRQNLRAQVATFGKSFGFYFEYLPTGTSIGVNEKDEFYAASLFKLPIVMAYYYGRERLHTTEDPTVIIKPDQIDNRFGDLWRIGAGSKIKMSDAVKTALEDSDNTAAKVVASAVAMGDFEAVYGGLDINLDVNNNGAILTPKNYSSILKALFFSAVLSETDSEQILNYLTQTRFSDKLVAGVPATITVAHKIGDFVDNAGNEAFMDCGIIYVPRRPYLLCMLSKTDEQTAGSRMKAVSKTIYDYMSSTQK